jgi:hypothetical protein
MKKLLLLVCITVIFFNANAQAPVNDEPCGAFNIAVTQDADGCTGLFTNITNATFTNLVIPFTCWTTAPNNLQQDVWYKFTAIAGVDKLYLMKFGFTFSNYVEIFTANFCNGIFVNIKPCFQTSGDGTSYPIDVIPGQVYYMRVTSTTPNQSNFNVGLCITTFKPSPNARVGINTKQPFSNLDIAGNVQVRDSIAVNNLSINGNFKIGNSFGGSNKVLTSDIDGLATWQNLPSGTNAWSVSGNDLLNTNVGNVGIGTVTPTSKLNVNGQITVDQKNFGGFGGLLLKGDAPGNNYPNIGFSVKNNSPFQTDEVAALIQGNIMNNAEGLETIDLTFHTSAAGQGGLFEKMRIKANGNVGIGFSEPGYPLNFASTLGDKISLFGNTGSHYGFGIQPGLLQMHANLASDNIAFGHGSSASFTERARIINSGTDGMVLKGRMLLQNGSVPLDVNQTPGVWLYKANNSALLGFMGTQNNQNIGFYGGPSNGGWGFVYDAINSRVGIGVNNPNAPLSFPALLGKKITLYPGATGDVGLAVAGNRLQIYTDNPNADVAIGYDAAGTFNEKFAVKANGALAVNTSTGTTGQVLTSNGNNAPATWMSPLAHAAGGSNGYGSTFIYGVSVLTNITRTITIPPGQIIRLLISANINYDGGGCIGIGCSTSGMLKVLVDGAVEVEVPFDQASGKSSSITVSNYPIVVGGGLHSIEFKVFSGDGASTFTPKSSTIIAIPL